MFSRNYPDWIGPTWIGPDILDLSSLGLINSVTTRGHLDQSRISYFVYFDYFFKSSLTRVKYLWVRVYIWELGFLGECGYSVTLCISWFQWDFLTLYKAPPKPPLIACYDKWIEFQLVTTENETQKIDKK